MTPRLQASKKKVPHAMRKNNVSPPESDASPRSVRPWLCHLSTELMVTSCLQASKKKALAMSHAAGNKGVSPPMEPARIPTSNDASSFEITLVCFCTAVHTYYG